MPSTNGSWLPRGAHHYLLETHHNEKPFDVEYTSVLENPNCTKATGRKLWLPKLTSPQKYMPPLPGIPICPDENDVDVVKCDRYSDAPCNSIILHGSLASMRSAAFHNINQRGAYDPIRIPPPSTLEQLSEDPRTAVYLPQFTDL
jgi:hypothetical protein